MGRSRERNETLEQMNIIFEFHNPKRTTEVILKASRSHVILYYFSVFDLGSFETDTYVSKPFSRLSFEKSLIEFEKSGECLLSESGQTLTLKRTGESCLTMEFSRSDGLQSFQIVDMPLGCFVSA